MIKKNLLVLTVAGGMVLPQIGMAQMHKPGQQQPPHAVQPQPPKPGQPAPNKPGQPQVKPAQPSKPAPQQPKNVFQTPKPAPQPPKLVPQQPKPAPVVAPTGEYRPGHNDHPLRPPKERDHYKDWKPLHHKQFYKLAVAPEMVQVSMRVGQEVEFKLEEKSGDGLKWFARYDNLMLDIDIDHENNRWYNFGRTAYSEVEIEARRPGNTLVELVYARPGEWVRGGSPQKVLQIFVHVE